MSRHEEMRSTRIDFAGAVRERQVTFGMAGVLRGLDLGSSVTRAALRGPDPAVTCGGIGKITVADMKKPRISGAFR